jgi:hypothetical protein
MEHGNVSANSLLGVASKASAHLSYPHFHRTAKADASANAVAVDSGNLRLASGISPYVMCRYISQ